MSKKNIKLIVEYSGTKYSGWQSQINGITVQDKIQDALYKTTGQKINLNAAGRTDAGVHALGQTANFVIEHTIEPGQYKNALNYYLPKDIIIKSSSEVPLEFHSRFDALSKVYRYILGFEKSALYFEQRWEISEELDFDKLSKSAEFVLGEHDFAPFCVVTSRKENNVCTIYSASWKIQNNTAIFEIKGNRFLHSMIRSMVGAMVNIALVNKDKNRQNLTLESFRDIIESSTDYRIASTAPAQGLYLVSVEYKKE